VRIAEGGRGGASFRTVVTLFSSFVFSILLCAFSFPPPPNPSTSDQPSDSPLFVYCSTSHRPLPLFLLLSAAPSHRPLPLNYRQASLMPPPLPLKHTPLSSPLLSALFRPSPCQHLNCILSNSRSHHSNVEPDGASSSANESGTNFTEGVLHPHLRPPSLALLWIMHDPPPTHPLVMKFQFQPTRIMHRTNDLFT
jgi:hypothetical protein